MEKSFFTKKRALPLLIVLGVGVALLMVSLKPSPKHQAASLPTTAVEVVVVEKLALRARLIGYGEVKPSTFLQANAEVGGRVVEVSPKLKNGAFLDEGELALRIDTTSYDLALAQAQADLVGNRANLGELAVEETNTITSLKIAQSNLDLGQRELARKKKLLKKGSVSRSQADAEEQNVLRLRQEVQSLQSQVTMIPTRRQVLEAQLLRAQAQVRNSEYNLQRTEVLLPFNARIGDVYVEQGQSVGINGKLFDASGMGQVEITVQFPLSRIRPLLSVLSEEAEGVTEVNNAVLARLERLQARVYLVGADVDMPWTGKVVRLGDTLDAVTRTVAMVVTVDNPYQQVIPGRRPPLIGGMYTKVELLAPPEPALVIPRRAVHQNHVYVVSEGTLQVREVVLGFQQGELSVVHSGIEVGDQVIVTDLVPAIPGMAVQASVDNESQQSLRQLASGNGDLK